MNFENDENLDFQLNKVASIVIKEKRTKKGYSLEELANKLNNIVTRQSLYRYENNEARMKNTIFKKICLALDENPNDVWEEINNRLQTENLNIEKEIEFDELGILFDKNKKYLTESDKNIIKAIIEERKKEIDKELGEE